jgi:glycosyltransferase involved in cell wall biosynthesis
VLRPLKGVEVLLEAIQRIANAHFLIVGDGPMREEWTQLADANGIGDRVHWAGYRRDVDAILPGCDLFVHPTLNDAFPTVLLEALAAGLPIVASRVGGVPEIVDDATGKLVPPGDANALAVAVNELLADSVSLARMRDAAQNAAQERFSTRVWIDNLAAVYREVLAAK